ncbi:putative amino acid transporter [Hortaea werneckii]|nr:putative amino acid transporter [Hortaea werneckii]
MASYAAIHTTPSEHHPPPPSRTPSTLSRSRSSKFDRNLASHGSASWLSSVINLLNTIVGAGVLAMPHAMANMGITLGIFVICWAGLTSGFGLYLQTRCARYLDRGRSSFFALSQITYPNAAVVFDGAIAIKCFGVGVSYLIIIGDLMPGVMRGFVADSGDAAAYLFERRFWVTAFMLVVIPLSFLRRLDSLKYTSVLALTAIAYLIVLVVYHYAAGDTLAEKGEVNIIKWQGIIPTLANFPVIVFAYTCHQNMFSILNEIKNPTHVRTTSVIVASIGTAASVYVLVAITGYLSYGNNVIGNIVAQYAPSVAATIARLAIVIMVGLSYPLQVHPCRASLDAVSRWRPQSSRASSDRTPNDTSPSRASLLRGNSANPNKLSPSASNRPRSDEMSELRFACLTTLIIILSYLVAMTVSSLDKVLAYVGSTGSTSISFILPGLFYYKISAPDSPHAQRLVKDEDDEVYDSTEEAGSPTEEGGSGLWRRDSWAQKVKGRQWRQALLRKLSLALAGYGVVVMVVCLVINTFFIVAH